MNRFSTVDEIEIEKQLIDKNSINTHKATKVASNIFFVYLREKQIEIDIETVSFSELNKILTKFYVEVRKKDGSMYSKSTLTSIRFGIQRLINQKRKDVNIIDSPEFSTANEIFHAQCAFLKKEGLGKVNHKIPIAPEDMKKLYKHEVFNLDQPKSLQRKVFFDLMLYLCRRRRENLRFLKKTDFALKVSKDGEYIEKVVDEMTKNRRENADTEEGEYVLATGTKYCPVNAFKLYLSVLNPRCESLFQRPKTNAPDSGPWYDAQAVGVNTLGSMMKNISIDAQLSNIYTNHCIRATSVTILDRCGFEARHIMSVNGHRSKSSIRSYSRTDSDMKKNMSRELSKFCENDATFDFGVEIQTQEDQLVPSSISSPSINTQSSTSTAKLSSLLGHCAQVEFNNCAFYFNQN